VVANKWAAPNPFRRIQRTPSGLSEAVGELFRISPREGAGLAANPVAAYSKGRRNCTETLKVETEIPIMGMPLIR
jgi:hypothetical protein